MEVARRNISLINLPKLFNIFLSDGQLLRTELKFIVHLYKILSWLFELVKNSAYWTFLVFVCVLFALNLLDYCVKQIGFCFKWYDFQCFRSVSWDCDDWALLSVLSNVAHSWIQISVERTRRTIKNQNSSTLFNYVLYF